MPGAELLDGRYAWTRLGISVLAGAIASVGIWAVILVLPAVQAEFGVDRAAASFPYLVTMAGFALGNLQVGRLVDRIGMARTLILAAGVQGAGFAAAAWAPSLPWFTAAQLLVGWASAAGFGPLIADISHWFLRRRGIAVSAAASANYIAGAVWPVLLKGTLAADGWRTTYLVIGASMAVLPLLALLLRRELPEGAKAVATARAAAAVGRLAVSPRTLQLLLAAAGLACCTAMAMPQVHIVALCADYGFGVAAGAEMLALMLAGGVASRLVSGLVADRIGGVRTLLIGSFAQMMALALYLPFDGLASLYVVSLVFGLSQGGIVPSYAIIVREYLPPEEAGRRVGAVLMATVLGMALGGWMSGEVYDLTGSYAMAFLNGILWNMVNLGIAVAVLMRTGPRPAPAVAA
jgi:MFS family permease